MTAGIIIFVVLLLAYSNGANDNFKGVATLYGSKSLSYKKALIWATITTFVGSLVSILLAGELLKNFSGKGLIPNDLLMNPNFAISVTLGAAITVFSACKIGMPISTTHALTGALAGTGIIAAGSEFNYSIMAHKFFIPLLISPFIALIGAWIIYKVSRYTLSKMNITEVLKEKLQKLLNGAHYLSSGVVCFSRGLNDTPKIAGILLLVSVVDKNYTLPLVAIAVVVGGLVQARKVANTMSNKLVTLNDGQGLAANLSTSLLVSTSSIHGLPVSTTHVSVGSILGIGIANKKGNWKVIKEVLFSWVLTLPISAIISITCYLLLNRFL